MAPWILYSLLAAAAAAFSSVIDKMVLSKWMTKPAGSYFVFGAIEALSGLAAFVVLGGPRLPFATAILALGTGAAFALSTLFYFQAINVDEVTRVVPLYNLIPIFTAVFAAAFLGEMFSPLKYLGVFLVIVGALLLTLKRLRGFVPGKGAGWMLLAVVTITASAIISKYLLASADPWTLFAYNKIGTLFATAPAWGKGLPAFRDALRRHPAPVFVFTFLSEALTSITTIFYLLAASTGFVTLVGALIGTQPFFLLLFSVLFSVYRPDLLREELGGRLILRKIAALFCLFIGVFLITQ